MCIICCNLCNEEIVSDIGCIEDCGHLFHYECGNKWLNLHKNCPICKRSSIEIKKLYSATEPKIYLFDDAGNVSQSTLEDNIKNLKEQIESIASNQKIHKEKYEKLKQKYISKETNAKQLMDNNSTLDSEVSRSIEEMNYLIEKYAQYVKEFEILCDEGIERETLSTFIREDTKIQNKSFLRDAFHTHGLSRIQNVPEFIIDSANCKKFEDGFKVIRETLRQERAANKELRKKYNDIERNSKGRIPLDNSCFTEGVHIPPISYFDGLDSDQDSLDFTPPTYIPHLFPEQYQINNLNPHETPDRMRRHPVINETLHRIGDANFDLITNRTFFPTNNQEIRPDDLPIIYGAQEIRDVNGGRRNMIDLERNSENLVRDWPPEPDSRENHRHP